MSQLQDRIANVGTANLEAMGDYHPYGTADTPLEMPANLVSYGPAGGSVERLSPLITANGAIIPARPPGRYGHVHMAGRG